MQSQSQKLTLMARYAIHYPKRYWLRVTHLKPSLLASPHLQKIPEWHQGMDAEINALIRNGTWSLVPPTSNMNIVGCRWVYKIK